MKKLVFLLVFFSACFFRQSHCAEAQLPPNPDLYSDKDGKIPPEFWERSPRIEGPGTKSLEMINTQDDLISFGEKYSKFSGLDNEDNSSGPEYDEFIQGLHKMGFVPEKNEPESGYFRFTEVKNPHLYYWCFESSVFVIFPENPHQAVKVCDFGGRYPGAWKIDEVISAENLSSGFYRFAEERTGKYDISASTVYFIDADLKNKKINSYSGNGYLKDLDHNGKKEWVYYYFCEEDKFGHCIWPYIFSWNGKRWADVSAKYPEFYKTEVYKTLKDAEKYCDEKSYPDLKLVTLLEQAALAGGPSAFKNK